MRPPRSLKLLEKSEAAMISGIEIYNKPDFKYREETFALLALNAWELVLKAKLLAEKKNDPRSVYVYEPRSGRRGKPTKKLYLKRNRSGNPQTISFGRAIALLENQSALRLDAAVKANLDALLEIRDNAAHYMNATPQLSREVLEIGTATIRNYVTLVRKWFSRDFSRYSLFLMPLAFAAPSSEITTLAATKDETRLLAFLANLAQSTPAAANTEYHVSLKVNLSFERKKTDSAAPVYVTDDPAALHVTLSEEDILKRYPWDYGELTKRMAQRYSDFKANSRYHQIRKPLLSDQRYVKSRYLDPGNPKSARKDFYKPNVLQIFDQHYTRK